jgi:hypothetical protein
MRDFSARVLVTGNIPSGAMNHAPVSFLPENEKDQSEAIGPGGHRSMSCRNGGELAPLSQ